LGIITFLIVTFQLVQGIPIKSRAMKTFRTIILLTGILVAGVAATTVAQTRPVTETHEIADDRAIASDKHRNKSDFKKHKVEKVVSKSAKDKIKGRSEGLKAEKQKKVGADKETRKYKTEKEIAKSYHKAVNHKHKHGSPN
jgi:hypothetical protein